MTLERFPQESEYQRLMMFDADEEVRYSHGGSCNYRTASFEEIIEPGLGSLPELLKVRVSCTHDINTPAETIPIEGVQLRVTLFFSDAILGGADTATFDSFMAGKSMRRFFDELAEAAGFKEYDHNVMTPGSFSASYGSILGGLGQEQTLKLNNLDLKRLRAAVRLRMEEIRNEVYPEIERMPEWPA